MIGQNPPIERATAMGYLDQSRQGKRSTRQATKPVLSDDEAEDQTYDEFLRFAVVATAVELTLLTPRDDFLLLPSQGMSAFLSLLSAGSMYIYSCFKLAANESTFVYTN